MSKHHWYFHVGFSEGLQLKPKLISRFGLALTHREHFT